MASTLSERSSNQTNNENTINGASFAIAIMVSVSIKKAFVVQMIF
jgi:hypothetical protein